MQSSFPETEVRFLVLALVLGGGLYYGGHHEWNPPAIAVISVPETQNLIVPNAEFTATVVGALPVLEEEEVAREEQNKESVPKPVSQIIEKISAAPPVVSPKVLVSENIASVVMTEEPKDPGDPNAKVNIALSSFSHYGSALIPGKFIGFSVIVKNEGTEATKSTFNTQLFLDKKGDGSIDTAYQKMETRVLEQGEQETKIWKNAWMIEAGMHKIRVCADIDREIAESLENDNCASLDFAIDASVQGGDFLIEGEDVAPISPKAGDNVSFSAFIKNADDVKAGVSTALLYIDSYVPIKSKMPTIPGEEREGVVWSTIWQATAGEHTYKICADGYNDIWETDEENNCVTHTFVVAD